LESRTVEISTVCEQDAHRGDTAAVFGMSGDLFVVTRDGVDWQLAIGLDSSGGLLLSVLVWLDPPAKVFSWARDALIRSCYLPVTVLKTAKCGDSGCDTDSSLSRHSPVFFSSRRNSHLV